MPKTPSGFPTIRDVARLASVSVATVSAVINAKGTASAEVRRRVEEAMLALDYHPDHMARSLKTGRSKVVGLVIPDVTNPFFTEVMSGLESKARHRGYSVILSNSNEDPAQERENLGMLYSQRVAGVVLACTDAYAAHDRLISRRFPIVFIDRLPQAGFTGRAVVVDNAGAAYEGIRHLIELGHEHIAIIAGRLDSSVGIERVEGFRKAMQEANLLVSGNYFQQGDFSMESGYRCGLELLKLPEPPTAVFACNNKMTLGLMRALTERGFSCPGDMSILSFDDFPWSSEFRPQLTALAQPATEIGSQAMSMLLSILEPESEEARTITQQVVALKATLKIRQSTAAPRRGLPALQGPAVPAALKRY
ncbi:MAG TPA: LacI family DNA-binding transcriptional regulator [Bryobacteraceae bacterium]|nr:LacI family DNA-binding transcriptional regulator [Bryobacteraceae bacterium]